MINMICVFLRDLAIEIAIGAPILFVIIAMSEHVKCAAELARLDGVIRGGWLVSESGRPAVCRTTCHAPDMELYRENLKSRRRGHDL